MKVFLIGVSCVGITTIGGLLAERFGWPFFDLNIEIEKNFGKPIERLKAPLFRESHFRKRYAAATLTKLLMDERDASFVMALFASGLKDAIWDVLQQVTDCVIVELRDSPENILSRIRFYDDDSKPIEMNLDEDDLDDQLTEIIKDIAHYRRSYKKAHMAVGINGLDAARSAEKLELALREWWQAQG